MLLNTCLISKVLILSLPIPTQIPHAHTILRVVGGSAESTTDTGPKSIAFHTGGGAWEMGSMEKERKYVHCNSGIKPQESNEDPR